MPMQGTPTIPAEGNRIHIPNMHFDIQMIYSTHISIHQKTQVHIPMVPRHLVKLWDLPQAMQHVGHHHNLGSPAVWGCNAESSLQAGLPSAGRFWSNPCPKRTFSLKASKILASSKVIICKMAGTFHKCLVLYNVCIYIYICVWNIYVYICIYI